MKNSLIIIGLIVVSTNLLAKSNKIINCRLVTSSTTECKPYPTKLIYTKQVDNTLGDRDTPVIIKTLPLTSRKKMKVVTVDDIFEKEVEVFEPIRYRGTAVKKEPIVQKVDIVEDVNLTVVMEDIEDAEEIQKRELLEERANKIKKFPLYEVSSGDSLIVLSKRFGVSVSDILEWNEIVQRSNIAIGDTLIIPISKAKFTKKMSDYRLLKVRLEKEERERLAKVKQDAIKKKRLTKQLYPDKDVRNKYQISPKLRGRSIRVQATAYSSHSKQTDDSPFLAAWNNRLRPGTKVIAVSRDLIRQHGLTNGAKVKISGLPGFYTVRDKMNGRYAKRIDIYMGMDRRRALSWGRRSVVISW